jgi:hypothetical protein
VAAGWDSDRIAQPGIDPARVPFEATDAYRRLGLDVERDPLAPEHLYTKAIIVEQGFDGLPHVVSREELNRHVKAVEFELFRGIAGEFAAAYAERLRTGPMWVGRGGRGGGIYAAGGPDGREHAAEYAQDPGGVIVRMSLKAGARIGDVDTLNDAREQEHAALVARGGATNEAAAAALAKTARLSVYAVYLGYDGVVDRSTLVWTIFNRTALRIQREDIRP